MDEVLSELKHNSKVKFKETDLFRVYQSVDLVRGLCIVALTPISLGIAERFLPMHCQPRFHLL